MPKRRSTGRRRSGLGRIPTVRARSARARRPPQTPPYVTVHGERLTVAEWHARGRPEPATIVEG